MVIFFYSKGETGGMHMPHAATLLMAMYRDAQLDKNHLWADVFHQRLKVVDSLWASPAVSRDEGRVHPLRNCSLKPVPCASKVGRLGGFSIYG